jgi:hypothetical protein
MLKSIGVVLGSYALSIILVFGTGPLLNRIYPGEFDKGHIPATAPLVWSTIFFVIASLLCAWMCARFAPRRPSTHVLWFFALGEVLGIASSIPNWTNGWPHWYPISWLITWPISCWIGFRMAGRRKPHPEPAPSTI